MTPARTRPLVAVDIGNTRFKLALFRGEDMLRSPLAEPSATLTVASAVELPLVNDWLERNGTEPADWFVASVNRPASEQLRQFLASRQPSVAARFLTAADLPLAVQLENPDHAGIDRLAAAAAANRIREPGRPLVVADIGTAVTVDCLSPEGVFLGGAILPGLLTAARALNQMTDMLPLLEPRDFDSPPAAIGTNTPDAMRSGLYWGAVGAVRELVAQYARGWPCAPQLVLTGGGGQSLAGEFDPVAQYLPHLTLSGIALAEPEP